MKRLALIAGAALLAATPALAQTAVTPPATVVTPPATAVPPTGTVQGGSPAAATSGPGSAGYVTPTGRAEDRVTNNPAAASNAEQSNQPIPQSGKGGGGGGGGSSSQ